MQCRLPRDEKSPAWAETDCGRCPVPAILLSNGSPDLALTLVVRKGVLGFGGGVRVNASCRKHEVAIPDPQVGCSQCVAEMFEGIDLGGADV